jgi:hypothetical protein
VSALASALTESTITASKTALSDALTLANDIQANYVAAGGGGGRTLVGSTATGSRRTVVAVVEADRIEQRADDGILRRRKRNSGDLSAHSKLVSALASALTESTITASKTALSDALTLACCGWRRRRENSRGVYCHRL